MIVNKMPMGLNNQIIPRFTYTGNYQTIDDGNGDWRIKFLTSGTLKLRRNELIDVFLVGGGASGNYGYSEDNYAYTEQYSGAGGGGGGMTRTVKEITATAGVSYSIIVGEGGSPVYSSGKVCLPGNPGGASFAFSYTAEGGYVPQGWIDTIFNQRHQAIYGGCGGSGGGAGGIGLWQEFPYEQCVPPTVGGSDGSNGVGVYAGYGQETLTSGDRTNTREFGEQSGTLYSGGGGGGGERYRDYPSGQVIAETGAAGGAGGGGKGASYAEAAAAGTTNTGGGGGGGYYHNGDSTYSRPSGAGGSGIVIIRNHRA